MNVTRLASTPEVTITSQPEESGSATVSSPNNIAPNQETTDPTTSAVRACWNPGDDDDCKNDVYYKIMDNATFPWHRGIKILNSQWKAMLAPLEPGPIQIARDKVLNLFAYVAATRAFTLNNGNSPEDWCGFFYRNEVAPVYVADRIPERLQAVYKKSFVRKDHINNFSLADRCSTYKTVDELVNASFFKNAPVIFDCGKLASLLQMEAYAAIHKDQPLTAINPEFLLPPDSIDYAIKESMYHRPNPPKMMNWDVFDRGFLRTLETQPLDLCYLENDLRYKNYQASSKGNAFDASLTWTNRQITAGPGAGFWLTIVGRNTEGDNLYIGLGENEGPMTLAEWRDVLRREFYDKWGELPEDFGLKSWKFFRSPAMYAKNNTQS